MHILNYLTDKKTLPNFTLQIAVFSLLQLGDNQSLISVQVADPIGASILFSDPI